MQASLTDINNPSSYSTIIGIIKYSFLSVLYVCACSIPERKLLYSIYIYSFLLSRNVVWFLPSAIPFFVYLFVLVSLLLSFSSHHVLLLSVICHFREKNGIIVNLRKKCFKKYAFGRNYLFLWRNDKANKRKNTRADEGHGKKNKGRKRGTYHHSFERFFFLFVLLFFILFLGASLLFFSFCLL